MTVVKLGTAGFYTCLTSLLNWVRCQRHFEVAESPRVSIGLKQSDASMAFHHRPSR